MKKSLIPIALILVSLIAFTPSMSVASTPGPAFQTAPPTQAYINSVYSYNAQVNETGNFTLKSNLTILKLTQNMNDYANTTEYASVWGTPGTAGSYYVNLTFNGSKLIYQNFTLTVLNEPFITSVPLNYYIPGANYTYNFTVNQKGNYTASVPSGFTFNNTSMSLKGVEHSGIYTVSVSEKNSNGSYTQMWEISDSPLSVYQYQLLFDNLTVNVSSPAFNYVGLNNTTLFIANGSKAVFLDSTAPYYESFDYATNGKYILTANSSGAPNITMKFSVLAKVAYEVVILTGSGKTYAQYSISSNTSSYALVYDPAIEPLDPTFMVFPYSPSPPPPVPPVTNPTTFLQNLAYYLFETPVLYVMIAAPIIAALALFFKRNEQ